MSRTPFQVPSPRPAGQRASPPRDACTSPVGGGYPRDVVAPTTPGSGPSVLLVLRGAPSLTLPLVVLGLGEPRGARVLG